MSASGDNAAPVIIKRKKVTGGDGHHGGAWKVAIACSLFAALCAGPIAPLSRGCLESRSDVCDASDRHRAIRFRTQAEKCR